VIRTFVFVSGAILMALEMVASRFLAPQYGNSIVVWASLISIFLAGLSIGYWCGGAFADRWPRMSGVCLVLLAGGAAVLLIPAAAPFVFRIAPSDPRAGSLVSAVLLFLAPTILMGSVSPYAIRLESADRDRLGRSSGRLYAISTAGSIFGTIATAFWLIPLAGIDHLTCMLGAALIGLAAVVAIADGEWMRVTRVAAAVAAGFALTFGLALAASVTGYAWPRPAASSDSTVLYVHDSFYHHIVVRDAGDTRYLHFDDSIQSAMARRDPLVARTGYTNVLHLGVALTRPRNVLMIGLGGGTLVKQFLHDYPDVQLDIVEIDPEVVDVASRYFAVPTQNPRARIFTEDGRRFLQRSDRRYDLIVLDAFNRTVVPFHLVTREFFELCRSRLAPGGCLEMNFIAKPNGQRNQALASVFATLGGVFSERYAFSRQPEIQLNRNWILVAGSGPQMSDPQLFATIASASQVRRDYLALAALHVPGGPSVSGAEILTDQFAPVEEMMR
jgi:spermidine synthase